MYPRSRNRPASSNDRRALYVRPSSGLVIVPNHLPDLLCTKAWMISSPHCERPRMSFGGEPSGENVPIPTIGQQIIPPQVSILMTASRSSVSQSPSMVAAVAPVESNPNRNTGSTLIRRRPAANVSSPILVLALIQPELDDRWFKGAWHSSSVRSIPQAVPVAACCRARSLRSLPAARRYAPLRRSPPVAIGTRLQGRASLAPSEHCADTLGSQSASGS